jgi:N-acylneuraminate cytidylyltransferase
MPNIAIIPARGGSKRIPQKNIKKFNGIPIIAYSIRVAIESKLFDEVMVSTDDEEIADIAIKYGANVPFLRSLDNSSDCATTINVLKEVISEYKINNLYFENTCCIYPCAPLIQVKQLYLAYKLLVENKYDTVFPIVKYSTPIQRAFKLIENKIEMFNPEMQNTRSQDLENSYYDAGQFYWANTFKMIDQEILFTNNSGSIILDETEAHDIDNEIDWKITEIKYSLLK